jgi:hypothetical protein
MPLSNQPKKLKEKLEKQFQSQSKFQFDQNLLPNEELPKIIKHSGKKNNFEGVIYELFYLKKILKMIKEGASGYDLAYLVEQQKLIKRLINEKGILFYDTFLEIGEEKFIEYPNKKITYYKNFKTVENTEKYFFIIWLRDEIKKLQKKYLFLKQMKKTKNTKDQVESKKIICKNCGSITSNENQKVCEKCGFYLDTT